MQTVGRKSPSNSALIGPPRLPRIYRFASSKGHISRSCLASPQKWSRCWLHNRPDWILTAILIKLLKIIITTLPGRRKKDVVPEFPKQHHPNFSMGSRQSVLARPEYFGRSERRNENNYLLLLCNLKIQYVLWIEIFILQCLSKRW